MEELAKPANAMTVWAIAFTPPHTTVRAYLPSTSVSPCVYSAGGPPRGRKRGETVGGTRLLDLIWSESQSGLMCSTRGSSAALQHSR
eukprot:scaffold216813_cov31-Tisochrysis_lutea.AAC.10